MSKAVPTFLEEQESGDLQVLRRYERTFVGRTGAFDINQLPDLSARASRYSPLTLAPTPKYRDEESGNRTDFIDIEVPALIHEATLLRSFRVSG